MMKRLSCIASFMLVFSLAACNDEGADTPDQSDTSPANEETPLPANIPAFNVDSAYHNIVKQVEFGPRVPNTAAHDKAAEWLRKKLESYSDSVTVQTGTVRAYDGTQLHIQNIQAHFGPVTGSKDILLVAHWDTRPWADRDDDPNVHRETFEGANDGGSGVAVLLEIARQLSEQAPPVGVTILLVDAEDYGTPAFEEGKYADPNTYCLGTQYWAKQIGESIHNRYQYGIVVDMVGGRGAHFLMEGLSVQHAEPVVYKVWRTAQRLGYGRYFIFNRTYPLTDDHKYLNEMANIPTIDIVDYDHAIREHGFSETWHTKDDNLQNIDRDVLKAVGHTVLAVIFSEAKS